ncbi:ATP synthase mitochondrial F1 complex assembly factor 2 [Heracleum sosnowskyi]|uniref:ATP synthase mitochondrial F1 complex assembly factor 2 n=1 Tax=Heracleum sosnowskyi TaxID=360622 RepID=A0AAD8M4M7_9APIA|nr:ATP synthase mitochondrial F1 complex assembly factor 2 [Heracleum sosnowskyi]
MALNLIRKTLISLTPLQVKPPFPQSRHLSAAAAATAAANSDDPSSSFSFSEPQTKTDDKDDSIYVKGKPKTTSSVTMPMSFMTGSIVGKKFYKKVSTREAEDGNGWHVMLDYRTLKTPSKSPLKCPNRLLAMAIAAEWDYQQADGIRPFTMPIMKLACTALERVPLTRTKIIDHLMQKFPQDLVFCRAPGDDDLTSSVLERQEEKIDPLLKWVESEFGFKPVLYSSFFGAHSLIIAIGLFRGKLQIEEAIELIRLEEDLQVDRWGLVEGGHDLDVADLKVQIASAVVFLGLSRRF